MKQKQKNAVKKRGFNSSTVQQFYNVKCLLRHQRVPIVTK